MSGNASYTGKAIGNVSNDMGGNGWVTYVSTGDMGMDWNFASRTGNFEITHFDTSVTPAGLSFGGPMCAPGVAGCGATAGNFGGPISGQLPNGIGISGAASGSFVRGPQNYGTTGTAIPRSIPQGIIGNWNVGSSHYNATGIFAGSR